MFVSTDIISAHRDGIPEEVARAGCASGHFATGIDPGIDCWRASLQGPLCCRLADAMVAQTVHQWILVIDPMRLWGRIGCKAARCVVPKVVITHPGEEGKTWPVRVLD